ncbi:MAG: FAD-binding oxidoreductase [Rhodospirillaceae bacterium]|nr:MAG: FAD-binding oxidoreductase [Rhodospirillaceae bacterium]
MQKFDVIVVGAGIAGSAAAFFLAQQGLKVALVEKGTPACGPTGRSSAVTHAFYLMPELSQLAIRGVEVLRQVPELTGGPKVHHEIGMLWVCGKDAVADWRDSASRIRTEGSKIDTLSVDDVAKLAPDLVTDDIALGLWEPEFGYADSYSATNALANGAKAKGCQTFFNTRVTALRVENGRIAGIDTAEHGKLGAERVIVAAGVWTKPLVAALSCDLPIHVERHEMAVLEANGEARKHLPFSWCDDTMCSYARPDGDRVILAGTWSGGGTGIRHESLRRPEPVSNPDSYKEGVEESESIDILAHLFPRMPKLEKLGLRPGYAGLYDMSPDDNPIVDFVPGVEGLVVVCGSSGHGFKIGPAIGEEAARLAMTGKSRLLAPFSLQRFA